MLRLLTALYFACLLLLLYSCGLGAAPFLIGDVPTANADTCVFTDNAGALFTSPVIVDTSIGVPANGNRVCKVDLSGSPVGTNNVKLRLRNTVNAPLWGDSTDVPLSFVRPTSTPPPSGLRLGP